MGLKFLNPIAPLPMRSQPVHSFEAIVTTLVSRPAAGREVDGEMRREVALITAMGIAASHSATRLDFFFVAPGRKV